MDLHTVKTGPFGDYRPLHKIPRILPDFLLRHLPMQERRIKTVFLNRRSDIVLNHPRHGASAGVGRHLKKYLRPIRMNPLIHLVSVMYKCLGIFGNAGNPGGSDPLHVHINRTDPRYNQADPALRPFHVIILEPLVEGEMRIRIADRAHGSHCHLVLQL